MKQFAFRIIEWWILNYKNLAEKRWSEFSQRNQLLTRTKNSCAQFWNIIQLHISSSGCYLKTFQQPVAAASVRKKKALTIAKFREIWFLFKAIRDPARWFRTRKRVVSLAAGRIAQLEVFLDNPLRGTKLGFPIQDRSSVSRVRISIFSFFFSSRLVSCENNDSDALTLDEQWSFDRNETILLSLISLFPSVYRLLSATWWAKVIFLSDCNTRNLSCLWVFDCF